MKSKRKNIVLFEHEKLKVEQGENALFNEQKLEALQKFYGSSAVPYFSLIHKGVQFNNYVGVIQVGNLVIEVLPKADKANKADVGEWRERLIGMMRAVNHFDIKATSQSDLRVRPNTILDLYIEMFVSEVEYLLRTGLVKQYREQTGNQTALKGNILFNKNIQENLIHKERFHVRHTIYDRVHILNTVLYKTILLIKEINTDVSLTSRINTLLLDFPKMPNMKITPCTFERITFNRKTEGYRKAVGIAKLLLLQYHPDLVTGTNHVLALMFDMNLLWEQFIYVSLRKQLRIVNDDISVRSQLSKKFWKPEPGKIVKIRPDIVIRADMDKQYVLDTKWKCLEDASPSTNDLRQMYVYYDYFQADKVALIYPGTGTANPIVSKGTYYSQENEGLSEKECSVMSIMVEKNIKEWQASIAYQIYNWMDG